MASSSKIRHETATAALQMVAEAGNTSTFDESFAKDTTIRTMKYDDAIIMGNTNDATGTEAAACYIRRNRLGIRKQPSDNFRVDVRGNMACTDGLTLCSSEEQAVKDVPDVPRSAISPETLTFHWAGSMGDLEERKASGWRNDVVIDGKGSLRARSLMSSGSGALSRLKVVKADADGLYGEGDDKIEKDNEWRKRSHLTIKKVQRVDKHVIIVDAILSDDEINAIVKRNIDLVAYGDVVNIGDTAYVVMTKSIYFEENEDTDTDSNDSEQSQITSKPLLMRLRLRGLMYGTTPIDRSIVPGNPVRLMRCVPDDRDSRWQDIPNVFTVDAPPVVLPLVDDEGRSIRLKFEDNRFSQAMILNDIQTVAYDYILDVDDAGHTGERRERRLMEVDELSRGNGFYELSMVDLSGGQEVPTKVKNDMMSSSSSTHEYSRGGLIPVEVDRPEGMDIASIKLKRIEGSDIELLLDLSDAQNEYEDKSKILKAVGGEEYKSVTTFNPIRLIKLISNESDIQIRPVRAHKTSVEDKIMLVCLPAEIAVLPQEETVYDAQIFLTGHTVAAQTADAISPYHVHLVLEKPPSVDSGARKALRAVVPDTSISGINAAAFQASRAENRDREMYELVLNNGPFEHVNDDGSLASSSMNRSWTICWASDDLKELTLRRTDGHVLPSLPSSDDTILPRSSSMSSESSVLIQAIPVKQRHSTTISKGRHLATASGGLSVGRQHVLAAPNEALSVFGDVRVDQAIRFCGSDCSREWEMSFQGDDMQLDRAATLKDKDAFFHKNVYVENMVHAKNFKTVSDARCKCNVRGFSSVDAHAAVMSVPVCQYSYIVPTDERSWHTGVLAQELKQVLPNAVTMHAAFLPFENPIIVKSMTVSQGVMGTFEFAPEDGIWGVAGPVREGDIFRGKLPSGQRIVITVKRVLRVKERAGQVHICYPTAEGEASHPLPPLTKIMLEEKYHKDVHSVDTSELLSATIKTVQYLSTRLTELEMRIGDSCTKA